MYACMRKLCLEEEEQDFAISLPTATMSHRETSTRVARELPQFHFRFLSTTCWNCANFPPFLKCAQPSWALFTQTLHAALPAIYMPTPGNFQNAQLMCRHFQQCRVIVETVDLFWVRSAAQSRRCKACMSEVRTMCMCIYVCMYVCVCVCIRTHRYIYKSWTCFGARSRRCEAYVPKVRYIYIYIYI